MKRLISGDLPNPLSPYEMEKVDYPLRVVALVMGLLILIYSLIIPDAQERMRLWGILVVGILYAAFQYRVVLPNWNRHVLLDVVLAAQTGVFVIVFASLLPIGGPFIALVMAAAVMLWITMAAGRWAAYSFSLAAAVTLLLLPGVADSFGLQLQWYIDWANLDQVGFRPIIWYIAFALLSAFTTNEFVLYMRRLMEKQIHRLRAINHVGQALVSTIEPQRMVEVLSETIRQALPADSYFIALLEGDVLKLQVLYDEGQFFDPITLDKYKGLAGWVLRHHQSLLLRDAPKELESLGLERRLVGNQRLNLSWLGAPMETGDQQIGIIAVGSYRPHAFTEDDRDMLQTIAGQATLALLNAYHHAAVTEESQRDSLTGAYNHKTFVEQLEKWVRHPGDHPFALIMLDIDAFKKYNDRYGHQVGDAVLVSMQKAIVQNLRQHDVVGRWGGEEFGIALRLQKPEVAVQIAERIHMAIASMEVKALDGSVIEPPTVSQGIAFFPEDATDVFNLVTVADRRLYKAKERGRSQIVWQDN